MRQEIKDAIEKAIKREQAAFKLYISLLKKAESTNLQVLFRTIALQELKHETLMKEFLKTGDMEEARKRCDAMYIEENLKIDDKLSPMASTMGIKDGIAFAIKEEINAAEYYEELMEKMESPFGKDVLYELVQEERKHERLLRKEYEKF